MVAGTPGRAAGKWFVRAQPPTDCILARRTCETGAVNWQPTVLRLAGLYNIGFGLGAVLFPAWWFTVASLQPPLYPSLWQCIGMIVGVYGVGYWIAAGDPIRHWPIVLVGLLGKVFGPIGFVMVASRSELPWQFGWVLLFNDLIWWLPFVAILRSARRARG